MESIPKHTTPVHYLYSSSEWIQLFSDTESEAMHAFDAIYRYYQPKLTRYVLLFLEDSLFDAKEVVQILFIKLWQKRNTLVGIRSFEKYLYRMARNATWDFLKEKKLNQQHTLLAARKSENRIEEGDGHLSLREYEIEAARVISMLPERRQQIFLLATQGEMPLDEIALEMNISKSVVKKQLYLATRFLKKYLIESQGKLLSTLFFLIFF